MRMGNPRGTVEHTLQSYGPAVSVLFPAPRVFCRHSAGALARATVSNVENKITVCYFPVQHMNKVPVYQALDVFNNLLITEL